MTKVIESNSSRHCDALDGFLKRETGGAAIEGDAQEYC